MAQPKSVAKPLQACVAWMPFGASLFSTIGFWVKQDTTQTAIAGFVTGLSVLWAKYSGVFMAEAEQEMEKLDQASARGLFKVFYFLLSLIGTVFDALSKWIAQHWWELTSDFEGKYYKRLNYLCRNFETQGLAQDRILNLQQVVVMVNVTAKSPTQISTRLVRKTKDERDLPRDNTIGHCLALMQKDPAYRRLAILGAPGSGKTTLMRYVTLMYALRKPRRLYPTAPNFIPVLLYLRDIYKQIIENPDLTLADLLTDWVQDLQRTEPLKPPKGWFAKKLKQKHLLILLDGLDEVADEQDRKQVSLWVDRQMYEYPETAFILTSRPLGYQHAQLKEGVTVLAVAPLTSDQIQDFVHQWYRETEIKAQGHEDLGVREAADRQAKLLLQEVNTNNALRDLAENPLLLTMIATVHRRRGSIPRNRVELYRDICQVLLEKRQQAKGIPDVLTASQKQAILQPLSLELMRRNTRKFTLADITSLLEAKLANLPQVQFTPEDFLKRLQEVDALIAKEQEGEFEFADLSFQEYLAAVEIKGTYQEACLLEMFSDAEKLAWWAETMKLYAAQGDATQLIETALVDSNFEKLLLAIDFWQVAITVNTPVQTALLEKLHEPLKVLDREDFDYATKVTPRYFKLAFYLQTQQWKAADQETCNVIKTVGDQAQKGYRTLEDIRNFPCSDLRVTDQLWGHYSDGRFGFSVQKDIYIRCGGRVDSPYDEKLFEEFGLEVGWKKNSSWVRYEELSWRGDGPIGHFPGWGCRYSAWKQAGVSLLSHPGL
ncbi:NACHT domain-containing protein [Leptolyngbyaceae cyanobacterium CCMR0082]|uniref:NACHT domain-containing protein n=1 Tax=Adonisia turfae CCMR0082 TaxID=2304604 RepID=A0A6M0SBT1_9CYAN|nr:GUN4 domain-containing protein [Adonisia turfae]NEZ65914.1 NACHT domain-containing protein [Adonisia turfae CCMR0082]